MVKRTFEFDMTPTTNYYGKQRPRKQPQEGPQEQPQQQPQGNCRPVTGRPSELVYTAAEAAAVLKVSEPTMLDLCNSEGFPSFKVGRRWYISCEALAEWVLERAGDH